MASLYYYYYYCRESKPYKGDSPMHESSVSVAFTAEVHCWWVLPFQNRRAAIPAGVCYRVTVAVAHAVLVPVPQLIAHPMNKTNPAVVCQRATVASATAVLVRISACGCWPCACIPAN